MKVFEAVRVNGRLVAKCVATGTIAERGLIREVQLKAAERNRQQLVVSLSGKVNRIAPVTESQAVATPEAAAAPGKMSFMSVLERRDPAVMFGNLERLTKMVGRGIQPSLVLTGMAGVGKTHLVKETLKGLGLNESTDFVHFKGRTTAAGLYITLYNNSNKIIVFDDCDSVFRDDDAVNILKAALDSYDTRRISYISSKPLKDEWGNPLPAQFEFTGRIIFISNINQTKLDEAIRSRSFVADITMTTDQMLTRMEQLFPTMEKKIPMAAKTQALGFIRELNDEYVGVEVNLRSLIKAARICALGFDNAKEMIAEQIIAA